MTTVTVADSGSWCWFSHPRAIRTAFPADQAVFGYVTMTGDVVVQSVRRRRGDRDTFVLGTFEADDHNNPSVQAFADGRLFVAYCRHNQDKLLRYRLSPTGRLADLGAERALESSSGVVSYSQVHILGDTVAVLYRVAPRRPARDKPRYWAVRVSRDGARTWLDEQILFDFGPGEQAYLLSAQRAGNPRLVDVALTGHPAHGRQHDVRYCTIELDTGAVTTPDGGVLANIHRGVNRPLAMAELFPVYLAAERDGVRPWIWDVGAVDASPCILLATFAGSGAHRYHHARYDAQSGAFQIEDLVEAGGSMATDERERYYSGGMCFAGAADRVFASVEVAGRFEIQEWWSTDGGRGWTARSLIAEDGESLYRPLAVRGDGADPDLLWLSGAYTFYTDFDTRINCRMGRPEARRTGLWPVVRRRVLAAVHGLLAARS